MTSAPVETALRFRSGLRKGAVLVIAALLLAAVAYVVLSVPRSEFAMKEIPVSTDGDFRRGPAIDCRKTACGDVSRYPRFVSSAPLFGEIRLDPQGSGGKALVPYHFALDESNGPGTGYDTLYFDANANLDLADDAPLASTGRVPTTPSVAVGAVLFERVSLPPGAGTAAPSGDLSFAPRLRFDLDHGSFWMYLDYAFVRQGKIRVGGQSFSATLLRGNAVDGRYDHPETEIRAVTPPKINFSELDHLLETIPPRTRRFQAMEMLYLGNKWYRLCTTPLGDRLSVKRYDGDLGIFRADVWPSQLKMTGLLVSRDGACLLENRDESSGTSSYTGVDELPVGDYAFANTCAFRAGPLHGQIEGNISSDGVLRDRENHPPRHFIEIRKDKAFTFEFPDKFEVLFASPPAGTRVRPGDTVSVNTALFDPVRDLRINSIHDSRRKVLIGGIAMDADLTANVEILDSSGNLVAGDTLSINNILYRGFRWAVPDALEPKDGRETFTITVTYDTLDLYGKIESSREIIVENPEGQ